MANCKSPDKTTFFSSPPLCVCCPLRWDVSQVSCGFLHPHQKACTRLIILGWRMKIKVFFFSPFFSWAQQQLPIHNSWHCFLRCLPEITPQPFSFSFIHLFYSCHRFGRDPYRFPDGRGPFNNLLLSFKLLFLALFCIRREKIWKYQSMLIISKCYCLLLYIV